MTRDAKRLDECSAQLPHGIFDLATAADAGASRARLYRLVASGRVVRVATGLFRIAQDDEVQLREWILARARRLGPHVIVAHASAAVLWGLRTPHLASLHERELVVLRTPETFGAHRRADVHTLPSKFERHHITEADGVRVTTLPRTVLDITRNCPFERALVATDHAAALGVQPRDLVHLAQYMSGWPGSRVFRPAIAHADGLAESGLESMARGRALAQGLPTGTAQLPVVGASGARYRADLGWSEARVVLEVDGREKYEPGAVAVFSERRRQKDLEKADWSIVRMSYEEIFADDRARWRELAGLLGTELRPYDANFDMTVPRELPRQRRAHRTRRTP